MISPRDLQAIDRGLGVLASLLQVPEVRTTVAAFHADFMAAAQQIEIMGDYKEIHDKLHQLQFLCYNSIVTQSIRFPDDEMAVDIITDHELTLQRIVVKLQEVAGRPAMASDELNWIQDLIQARVHLTHALETHDIKSLKSCCWLMRRILDRYPSLINTRLNAAARALRMGVIVQAMIEIEHALDGLDTDPEEAQAFKQGVTSLANLSGCLTPLVIDHDRWQDLDVQLRLIEAGIDRDLEELQKSWPYLQAKLKLLMHDDGDELMQNLGRYAAALDQDMTELEPAKTRLHFKHFRRVAGERFFQVDTELKDLCGQLRDRGTPLAAVARIIAAGMPLSSSGKATRPGGGDRDRLKGQLAEQRRRYDALTDQIAAIETDIGRTLDSEQRLMLGHRINEREAERSAVSAKLIEIEAQLAAFAG